MTAEGATPKASDHEVVRPRSGPTTKSSDAEGVRPRSGPIQNRKFVDVVMSSDVNSVEIGFLRLSAFQIGTFYRISTSKCLRNRDFEADHFVVGRLRRRTPSASDHFVVGRLRRQTPSAVIIWSLITYRHTLLIESHYIMKTRMLFLTPPPYRENLTCDIFSLYLFER